MFGTFDYNKVALIKAFIIFLFPANDKISKNCSRSIQYRCYKDQQKFYQEIYTCLGKLVLTVTPLVQLAAGLERYAKVISILSTERWKKTINFTSNCQPFEQRGSPFVTNLLSSSNRTTYFMSYRSRLRDGSMQLSLFTF